MSYHDVLVTCSKDKVLLVYIRNCSLFPQKNYSSYHLRRILPSNQTKVFHSFSFSLFKANEWFLIGLKSYISGFFFLRCLFQKAVLGLVDNLYFALWSHIPASIALGSFDWHIKKDHLFWTSVWVLIFEYKWVTERFLGWRDKTTDCRRKEDKKKIIWRKKMKLKSTENRDSASHRRKDLKYLNFLKIGLQPNCVAKPPNMCTGRNVDAIYVAFIAPSISWEVSLALCIKNSVLFLTLSNINNFSYECENKWQNK